MNTKDRNFGKESLSSFIDKKREMFLLQYSLGVKKDEIKKLEEIIQVNNFFFFFFFFFFFLTYFLNIKI